MPESSWLYMGKTSNYVNLVMCIHNVAICIALEKHSADHEGTEEELYLSAIT